MDAKTMTPETLRQLEPDDYNRLREDFYRASDAILALEETAADLKLDAEHALIVQIRKAFDAKLEHLARAL